MSHFITVINSCKSSFFEWTYTHVHKYTNRIIEWMSQSFFDTSKIMYIYIYICTYVWIWWILSRVYLLRKTRKNFIPAVALLFARLRFQERNFHHCWNIRPGNRVSEFHTSLFSLCSPISLSSRTRAPPVFGQLLPCH